MRRDSITWALFSPHPLRKSHWSEIASGCAGALGLLLLDLATHHRGLTFTTDQLKEASGQKLQRRVVPCDRAGIPSMGLNDVLWLDKGALSNATRAASVNRFPDASIADRL